jgi:outer membrane protein TolC
LLPSVDLSGSYGNFDLDQGPRHDWATTLTLTIPLFEKFQGWSGYKVAALAETESEISRESIQRDAPAEFESLKRSFIAARESALLREKTALMSENLFSDALKRFQLGRSTVNDLAIEQKRLLDSQLLEVQGWADAHRDLARVCHALGRFIDAAGDCRNDPSPIK